MVTKTTNENFVVTATQLKILYPVGIHCSAYGLELIRQCVNRALNCWDQAPPELKELGDILAWGHPLQDYQSQDSYKPRSEYQDPTNKNLAIPSIDD